MSRRIQTKSKELDGVVVAAAAAAPSVDGYLDRLLKYIPTEIVGLYMTARGIISGGEKALDLAVWGACLVLTFIYLAVTTRDAAQEKGPLWTQVILGTIAFAIWALNIGGPFEALRTNHVAPLLLVFSTVCFGFVKPKP